MSVTTLAPNGSSIIGGTPTAVGAASMHAALADSSDASYVEFNLHEQARVTLDDFTLAAGAVIKAVRVTARLAGATTGSGYFFVDTPLTPQRGGVVTWTTPTDVTYEHANIDGTTFTDAGIDAETVDLAQSPSGSTSRVYKVTYDVVYVEQPTVSADGPTGTVSDTSTPEIEWAATLDSDGGAQAYYQVKVFNDAQYGAGGFDPNTSTPVDNSGVLDGAASTWTPDDLPNDVYRAYVQVAQLVNGIEHWSDWDYVGFTVAADRPDAPTLTATADDDNARVELEVDVWSEVLADYLEIQRSIDAGATWVTIRADDDGLVVPTLVEFTNLISNPSFETNTTDWSATSGSFNDLTSISGLQGWWKADALALNDGDAVSSWTDSSGNSRPLVQATGSLQPTLQTNELNGKPVVRFDKTDDFMQAAFTLPKPAHVFVVSKFNQAYVSNDTVFDGVTVNSGRLQRKSSTTIGLLNDASPATTTPESFHIYGAVFDGASSELRIDGGAADTSNEGATALGGISVNRPGGFAGQYGGIDVAEILVFNTTLSAPNRQLVEGYLAQKYNISGPAAPSGGATITRVNTWAASGTWSGRFQVSPGWTGAYLDGPSFAVTEGQAYSARIAYDLDTLSAGNIAVAVRWSTGATASLGTLTTPGTGVASAANLTAPAGATTATIRLTPSVAATIDISVDAAMVVAGSTLPDEYFDEEINHSHAEVADYEVGNDVPVIYRARAKHVENGVATYSDWSSSTASTEWESASWWLKSPTRPALNMAIDIDSQASMDRPVREGVHDVLGRSDPIVVRDKRGTWRGAIRFRLNDAGDQASFDDLLDLDETLLLQAPPTDGWTDRYVSLGNQSRARAADKAFVDWGFDSLPWIEVAEPDGDVVAWPA